MNKNYFLKIFILLIVFLFANTAQAEEYITDTNELPDANAYKAVVTVNAFSTTDGDNLQQYSSGSGVMISKDGVILTNYHVVTLEDEFNEGEMPSVYQVCLSTSIENEPNCHYGAKLIAKEKDRDIALLKLDPISGLSQQTSNFKYLDLADTDNTNVNDTVIVMGYPAIGGSTITMTRGIVSGKEEKFSKKWIKTDAVFSFGSSGGAAIDDQGDVIGLVSFAHSDYLGSLGYLINTVSIKDWVATYKSATPQSNDYLDDLKEFTKKQVDLEESNIFRNDYVSIVKPSDWEFLYDYENQIYIDKPSDDDGGYVALTLKKFPYKISLDVALNVVKSIYSDSLRLSLINTKTEDVTINGLPAQKITLTSFGDTKSNYYLVNNNYLIEVDYDYGLNDKDEDSVKGIIETIELPSYNVPVYAPSQYTNDSPQFSIKSDSNWHILEKISKEEPINMFNKQYPKAEISANVMLVNEEIKNYNNQEFVEYLEQIAEDFNNSSSLFNATLDILESDTNYYLNDELSSVIYTYTTFSKSSTGEVLARDASYLVKSGNKYIELSVSLFDGSDAEFKDLLMSSQNIIQSLSLSASPYQGSAEDITPEPESEDNEDLSDKQPEYMPPTAAGSLSQRLKGRILLQVEDNGEAWYVKPENGYRIYMRDGTAAYSMMRDLGLGITNENLEKIPVGIEDRFESTDTDGDGLPDKLEEGLGTDVNNIDTDGDGYDDRTEILNGYSPLNTGSIKYDNNLVNNLLGKIVLQVESRGEAWYINPVDGKRYYMKDGSAAYQIMRYLSLGISNTDLSQIPEEQ